MDTQQLLELYKESLESVLKCLQDKKCSADKFEKLQELQKKIPSQRECEDTDYNDFVKTSKLVREQLDTHVRKVEDCGLVLKRIWGIRSKHTIKIAIDTSSKLLSIEEANSEFKDYFKVLIGMETMMESIGKKDEIPVKSPDDATSQALSQERKETENVKKNQKSTDVHKEDSVDEDNQDVVLGDNSNPIRQQPITDEQEMNTEEDKEPQHEDVVKDDGSKLREELYKTKTSLDEPREMSNTQKEEQDRMIKKLEIECDQLKEQVETLEKIKVSSKDENERLSKIQESELNDNIRNLTDEKIEIDKENKSLSKELEIQQNECEQLKARIEEINADLKNDKERYKKYKKDYNKAKEENTTLQQRLKSQEKYTKETERSEQRSLRPQTAPHSSARQLHNQIATLKADKESLMQRLSMVAGMKMRDNNPGIADLSDPNRPEKLAEQFREIYDNAWTNLLDYITDNTDATDDITVHQIVSATQKIFEKCQKEIGDMKLQLLKSIGYPEDTFEKQYTGGKDGHDPVVKMMKDLVQISAERIYERVLQKIKEIGEIKTVCQIGGKSADVFLTKCSKLCLFMCVKDPPVVLDFNYKRGDPFNKEKLSAFTKAGDSVDYLVWPVMYLNENGPVMSKGIAQGRMK